MSATDNYIAYTTLITKVLYNYIIAHNIRLLIQTTAR